MRKLVFAINLTTDGCCDHTKGIPDEELYNYHIALLRNADTLLYGRKTYQLMVPFWPDIAKNNSGATKADNDFARVFDAVDQIVVFSQSLDRAEGKKTTILRENLEEEILKLKQGEGKNILTGGVDLPSQLMALGLIDEFHLVVQPLVAGVGRRLFDGLNLPGQLKLKLIDSKIFQSGCVALRYVKG